MSKLNIAFNVAIEHPIVQEIFVQAINHLVENCQCRTSSFAQALMMGTAVKLFQHGSAFVGAFALNAGEGHGARHPTATMSKVSIPASATTYGGEMIVTATPAADGNTTIEIRGRTQGLFGGTLKKNVYGLQDFLIESLPSLANQYKQYLINQEQKQVSSKFSVAEEMERLLKLRNSGVLNETKYEQAKRKVLLS